MRQVNSLRRAFPIRMYEWQHTTDKFPLPQKTKAWKLLLYAKYVSEFGILGTKSGSYFRNIGTSGINHLRLKEETKICIYDSMAPSGCLKLTTCDNRHAISFYLFTYLYAYQTCLLNCARPGENRKNEEGIVDHTYQSKVSV